MRAGVVGVCVVAVLLVTGCGSGRTEGALPPSAPDDAKSSRTESEAAGTGSQQQTGTDPAETSEGAPDRAPTPGEILSATTKALAAEPSEVPGETDTGAEPAVGAEDAAPPQAGADGPPLSRFAQGTAPELPSRFESDVAPEWPFQGLVQLWYEPVDWGGQGWVLRYWNWDRAARRHPQVHLEGLEIECLGRVALVVHGEHGVEVGGAPGDVSATYLVPWGAEAASIDEPSEELLNAVAMRPSDVAVSIQGDRVTVGEGPQSRDYEMRHPLRGDGERWSVQARGDGELFVLTVHPAHLECFSGVTWLSLASTGELVACGANTAATAFVGRQAYTAQLVLPESDHVGTYLSCATQLDLTAGYW